MRVRKKKAVRIAQRHKKRGERVVRTITTTWTDKSQYLPELGERHWHCTSEETAAGDIRHTVGFSYKMEMPIMLPPGFGPVGPIGVLNLLN